MANTENKIYKGDIGTQIVLNVETDISAATAYKIFYKKPTGVIGSWIASLFTGDPNAKSLYYVTQTGDIDKAGNWKLQAHVTTADGAWYGLIVNLRVYEPIM